MTNIINYKCRVLNSTNPAKNLDVLIKMDVQSDGVTYTKPVQIICPMYNSTTNSCTGTFLDAVSKEQIHSDKCLLSEGFKDLK
jgi:hypothetical protein